MALETRHLGIDYIVPVCAICGRDVTDEEAAKAKAEFPESQWSVLCLECATSMAKVHDDR